MTCRAGQSTAEYAVLIAVVIAAAVGMQTFVKRALQARYRVASDQLNKAGVGSIGGVTLVNKTDQYEPYYAFQDIGTKQELTQSEEFTADGTIVRSVAEDTRIRGQSATKEGQSDAEQGGSGGGIRAELSRAEAADPTTWNVTDKTLGKALTSWETPQDLETQ